MNFVLTPGQRHEASVFEEFMTGGKIKRPDGGRPRVRPKRVCGDKGYTSRKIRSYLRRRGIRHTIPRKRNEKRTGPFDEILYRLRNQVERSINRPKQFRRIATRARPRESGGMKRRLTTIWRCCTSGQFYSGCRLQTRPSPERPGTQPCLALAGRARSGKRTPPER